MAPLATRARSIAAATLACEPGAPLSPTTTSVAGGVTPAEAAADAVTDGDAAAASDSICEDRVGLARLEEEGAWVERADGVVRAGADLEVIAAGGEARIAGRGGAVRVREAIDPDRRTGLRQDVDRRGIGRQVDHTDLCGGAFGVGLIVDEYVGLDRREQIGRGDRDLRVRGQLG